MRIRLTAIAFAASLAPAGTALGAPHLVADLAPTVTAGPRAASVLTGLPDGRILFWSEINPELGRELYVTDGTAAGTELLADTCPGPCNGARFFTLTVGPWVMFEVDDYGFQYWVTDGTVDGTFKILDRKDPQDSCDLFRAPLRRSQRLLFARHSEEAGCEPWIFDPATRAWEAIDAYPGPFSSDPHGLGWEASVGAPVSLITGDNRLELWLFDAEGESQPRPLASATVGLPFEVWVPVGKGWVFLGPGPDDFGGRRLWRTDGTIEGTARLPDPPGVSFRFVLGTIGPRAILMASDHDKVVLWRTNGTEKGTRRVSNPRVSLVPTLSTTLRLPILEQADDYLAFLADDGEHGTEVWRTDGTRRGTVLSADLCPGTCSSRAVFLARSSERVVFTAETPTQGRELWSLGPNGQKPHLIFDTCAGECSRQIYWLGSSESRTLFTFEGADDALWITDGSLPGTRSLEGWALDYFGLETVAGADYFSAIRSDTGVDGLARTDGTPEGTAHLDLPQALIADGSHPLFLAESGGVVYFLTQFSGEQALWVSDGTALGTRQVPGTLPPLALSGGAPEAVPFGDGVVFATHSGTYLIEGADGPVTQLTPCWGSTFLARGARIWFDCGDLWVTDGTPSGTLPVQPFDQRLGLVPWGSSGVAFIGFDEESRRRLYRTEDSPATIQDVGGAFDSGDSPRALQVAGGRLYVWVDHTPKDIRVLEGSEWKGLVVPEAVSLEEFTFFEHPRGLGVATRQGEVWSTDGSENGFLLHGIWAESDGSISLPTVTTLSNGLLFVTDGQAFYFDPILGQSTLLDFGGDYLLNYLRPKAADGRAYFVVKLDEQVYRLVRTTGIGASLETLAESAGIGDFLPASDGRVFFSNWTKETGEEPWIWEP